MSRKIQRHLAGCYPKAADIFISVGIIPKLRPSPMPLAEAVVRVVVGQMLSSIAARTIYSRLRASAQSKGLAGTWQLNVSDLRAGGLSRSKARAVSEFALALKTNPFLLSDWPELPADEVMARINSFWGMSEWTASILALFHLGHEDVFPSGDGSLRRAVQIIETRPKLRRQVIEPLIAQPYRSYLALYLWRALDEGVLESS